MSEKSIAVVTSFWDGDLAQASAQWAWLDRLGMKGSYDHYHLYKFNKERLGYHTFDKVLYMDFNNVFKDYISKPHPVGPNLSFVYAFKEMQRLGYFYMLWLEPDCIPLSDKLIESYRNFANDHPELPIIGGPTGGGLEFKNHYPGCSMYNLSVISKLPWDDFTSTDADKSFDIWMAIKLQYIELLPETDEVANSIIYGNKRYKWKRLSMPAPVMARVFDHWRPHKFLRKKEVFERILSGKYIQFHSCKSSEIYSMLLRKFPAKARLVTIEHVGHFQGDAGLDGFLARIESEIENSSSEQILVISSLSKLPLLASKQFTESFCAHDVVCATLEQDGEVMAIRDYEEAAFWFEAICIQIGRRLRNEPDCLPITVAFPRHYLKSIVGKLKRNDPGILLNSKYFQWLFKRETPVPSSSRLAKFKDIHLGARAILLCNGPSLNEVDFKRISDGDFVVFGLNKIFLGIERFGVNLDYIVSVNKKVIEQSADEFNGLKVTKFIGSRVDESLIPESEYTYHIKSSHLPVHATRFSRDISEYVHEGWTVTHAALQIIHYMGIREVYILGMDHRFKQHVPGKENQKSIISGADLDHFNPSYFGYGKEWDLPDLRNSEISYKSARVSFAASGGDVFDCTINGACQVFKKLPIEVLYNYGVALNKSRSSLTDVDVTIVIPFFNPGKYFERAIGSIYRQGLMKYEVLLIDDGSTDGSRSLAKFISDRDVRYKLLDNLHSKGVSGARNTGLDHASGRFIAFLDADDVYDDFSLSKRLHRITSDDHLKMVHSVVRLVDENGRDLGIKIGRKSDISFNDCYTNPVHLNGVLISSSALDRIRFDEKYSNGEDWNFVAEIFRSGIRSLFLSDADAVYRVNDTSAVMSDIVGHEEALVEIVNHIYTPSLGKNISKGSSKGLSVPSLDEVLLQRRASTLINLILMLGGITDCARYLKDNSVCEYLLSRSDAQLSSLFLVPAARLFKINMSAGERLDQRRGKVILDHIVTLEINRIIPNLYKFINERFIDGSESTVDTKVPLLGHFARSDSAHYDETIAIRQYFLSRKSGLMVDIGAHEGYALMPFLNDGWHVFAFEPDNKNRTKLLERLTKHKNKHLVSLDTRCVSNKPQKSVSFFASEQSTGISGLSAFHETHQESQKVDITTLTEFFEDKSLPEVDFLKIDTEGHDLFVLQGFPWERGKPAVIECEFEDTKTVPLGYTFHDLARFLVDKGYTVYVSEWHPIIRYGIRHDWRQLMRYPCELADPKGWGNLLAFRDPIDEQALIAAVKKVLKVGAGETAQMSVAQPKPAASAQSAVAIQVSGANLGFRFEPGAHFTSIAPNQWRFTDADAKQKLWVAAMDSPGPTLGRSFIGSLRVMADRAMTVNISCGRYNVKSEYEGTTKGVVLTPGVPQTVKLDIQFKQAHQALKLQVEVLDLPGGGSAVLTIDSLGIGESLASIWERVGAGNFDLRTANRLFRESDYLAALGIYLWLSQQRPLSMYADNAVKAARKAGMPWVNTPDELVWITAVDQ